MFGRRPALPAVRAATHAVGACLVVVAVWIVLALDVSARTPGAGLAIVTAIGLLAWTGASLVVRPTPRAANDNLPHRVDVALWRPVDDTDDRKSTLRHLG
ncbi:MAG: hypothetical protein V4537_14125 [Pseudomonadota bacterium]